MARYTIFAIILASVLVWWKPATVQADTLHCFDQSGFCVSNPVVWDYFTHRGGVNTFGYPISQQFLFEGSQVQFFQRRVIQIEPNGQAGLLNVLDPDIMPYTQFNGATFPAIDPNITSAAPPATNQAAALAFVQAYVPNTWEGSPVNFDQAFLNTVTCADAYPNGDCQAQLLPGFDLEMWGLPTSMPAVDPNNHNFIYQRFQRGVMMYDASNGTTQGVLFGQYLKDIMVGCARPTDLCSIAATNPLWSLYWGSLVFSPQVGSPSVVADLSPTQRQQLCTVAPFNTGFGHWAYWTEGIDLPGFYANQKATPEQLDMATAIIDARRALAMLGIVIETPGSAEGAPGIAPGYTGIVEQSGYCR